mmetsp:Transcript_19393/g.41298  ORF Transcript_19393/g.41298 Transcript_19393/m.41298 type:complete len:460 (-) Transcript_19393:28-1407(-)
MADALSPRLKSDDEGEGESGKETEASKKDNKVVRDGLKAADTWDAKGVDVDKRMLEGRRANRGFTMSVGRATEDVDIASLRKEKRAQTLPAMSHRRGDELLSADVQEKLQKEQVMMKERARRGSVGVPSKVVEDKELAERLAANTDFHVYGLMTEGQAHGDERPWSQNVKSIPAVQYMSPIVACQKGRKGFRDTTPNQDNFSITNFKNGWTLACAFDGHGSFGHLVSTRTVQTVPYFLVCSESFPDKMEAALIEAFDNAQRDVVAFALQGGWDVQASGSTAVAAIWKDNVIYTANVGDSRCVIGTEVDRKLVFATADHKPTEPAEKERIDSSGGEVRSQTYSDGWTNHRIYVKGEDYPGLCMARSLGDESVKAHGVIATPEVARTEVELDKSPFVLLASDGVWEFLDSQFVVKAVAKKLLSDGPAVTLQKLQKEAKKRWKMEEGDYCDDITSILIQLKS